MLKGTNFMKVGDKVNIDCGDYTIYGKIVDFECEMYVYAIELTGLDGKTMVLHADTESVKDGTLKFSDLRVEP